MTSITLVILSLALGAGLSEAAAELPRRRRNSVIALAMMLIGSPSMAHYHHSHGHLLPDPHITPGEVIATADTALLCAPGYANRPGVRRVSGEMKARVYWEYGVRRTDSAVIPPPAPALGRSICCEVDHLVPLELGGSNGIRNPRFHA